MAHAFAGLSPRLDRGVLTRRVLLSAISLAALSAPLANAVAQGRCSGTRAGSSACDTTPWKAPFESTGWKTTGLDHFSVQAVDYKKEAAYYEALMGWKILGDDGKQAVLQLGSVGQIVIRGGFTPPPTPPAPPAPAAGDTAGRGGRAGGGGARAPRQSAWDSFAWVIAPWDSKKVEVELKKRGLNPVADNDGDFQSFHVKDPDGFDVQLTNGKKHASYVTTKSTQPLPFDSPGWKTVWLDHISFEVSNYKESAAFYKALLGWNPTSDEGSQNETEIGDVGNVIIRGGNPAAAPAGGTAAPRRAQMGHVSFGITPFEPDAVKGDLSKRGLNAREDTGGKGDIHSDAAKYKSYHTTTPQGFDLQISNANKANRTVR